MSDVPITFVGHPWSPMGMAEQLRSYLRACTAIGLPYQVYDLFRHAPRDDPAHAAAIGDRETTFLPPGIRIFHINGDEVPTALAALAARGDDFAAGVNIIVPAWELPRYPAVWARHLAKFHEVWAMSRFVADSLATAKIASVVMGASVQPTPGPYLPRCFFEIRESAFVLLNFFDLSSFVERKNPQAVLALMARLRDEHPGTDIQLVLKVKNADRDARAWAANIAFDPRIKVIATPLDQHAVTSLVNACDCFVSLHRAEGFGRGLGEAMALGRLALGTGWSGNTDFMDADNALLVRHTMRPVKANEYPHHKNQSWAEPDISHACDLLRPVLANPARGRAMAGHAQADVLRTHGDRAIGLRVLGRLEEGSRQGWALPPLAIPRDGAVARHR
jgi:hypothetical protein